MIYWVRIILLGVLALALSINANGKDTSCDIILLSEAGLSENETEFSENIEKYSSNDDSCLLSSELFYAGRTLSHLLKTRRINASAAFCLSNSTSKDNHNNKFILPVITVQHHFSCVPKFITGRFLYINPHSRLSHSKSYYIYTLERIVI